MKVFVCCLFVTITMENWNKFHPILLLLTPLHQTSIWQTKLFMDGNKYTKLFHCDVISLFPGLPSRTRCQNHMMTKSARMDRNIQGLRGWVAAHIPQLTAISETTSILNLLNSHHNLLSYNTDMDLVLDTDHGTSVQSEPLAGDTHPVSSQFYRS